MTTTAEVRVTPAPTFSSAMPPAPDHDPAAAATMIRGFACHGKGEPLVPFAYAPRPLGPGDVEVEIDFCGICGSDVHTLDSGWGPSLYPVIVGHEIIGRVVRAGEAVTSLSVGDHVGVGAQVLACGTCNACVRGLDNHCARGAVSTYNDVYPDAADGVKRRRTGARAMGGYAARVRVDARWAFRLPAGLNPADAAPLLCAGVTVFAPLRREVGRVAAERAAAAAAAGTPTTAPAAPLPVRVGVVGIGGLGHLALQFAAKMGCQVTAVSHSDSKRAAAATLGATRFVASGSRAELIAAAGSLDVIVVTASAGGLLDAALGLLDVGGTAVLVDAPEEALRLRGFSLLRGGRALRGSMIGSRAEVRATLEFAAANGVRPVVERFPMERVNEALAHVRAGGPRYRVVLERSAATFAAPAL
ncbi:hypothetical protein HK405_002970 [Cladochytrium tenue]|nr:hypothetical protein HK405_002970 [Cladochytrium tenue]